MLPRGQEIVDPDAGVHKSVRVEDLAAPPPVEHRREEVEPGQRSVSEDREDLELTL
jgi:hypothetical protein